MGYPEAQYVIDELKNDISDVYNVVGAKIVCRGYVGAQFTISRADNLYDDIVVEITEESRIIDSSTGLRAILVDAPIGQYSIEIDLVGITMNATVNVKSPGEHYTFDYIKYEEIARFTSNGNFTVPNIDFPYEKDAIYVDAIAGGGCGGSSWGSSSNYPGGGGGGGCGGIADKLRCSVHQGDVYSATIGSGSPSGTKYYNPAGSTVFGTFFTLTGGYSGEDGSYNSGRIGGEGGKAGSPNGRAGEDGNGVTGGAGATGIYGRYGAGGDGKSRSGSKDGGYGDPGFSGIIVIFKKSGVY